LDQKNPWVASRSFSIILGLVELGEFNNSEIHELSAKFYSAWSKGNDDDIEFLAKNPLYPTLKKDIYEMDKESLGRISNASTKGLLMFLQKHVVQQDDKTFFKKVVRELEKRQLNNEEVLAVDDERRLLNL
jgi:hypothetical protein